MSDLLSPDRRVVLVTRVRHDDQTNPVNGDSPVNQ
jgi:hypothetical protein